MASNRKPYNADAGYVCSLKCPDGGHVVIYDRESGGDWIDGDERWVLAKYDSEGANQGLLDFSSQRAARDLMKDTAKHGCDDWYEAAATDNARPECPCDSEKTIDPHCAALGECARDKE